MGIVMQPSRDGVSRKLKGIVMQTGLIYGNRLKNRRVGGEGSGKKMEGSGMEDSKGRRGDKGEQTHAKLPPVVSGDLGSGDRGPLPPREKGRATDCGRSQRGAGQGTAQDSINNPASPGCQGERLHSTVGLRSPSVAGDA